MIRGLLAAAAVAVVIVMAGCGGGGSSNAFATASEMSWLTEIGILHLEPPGCFEDATARLGAPPTARLVPAYRLLLRACRTSSIDYATDILWNEALDRAAVGEFQPLPDKSGSYIYGAGVRVASKLAGRRVQVRCWSEKDWAKLEAERGAEGIRVDSAHFEIAGFAGVRERVINLSPDMCQELDSLTHSPLPVYASDDVMLDWAYGVTTLAHEAVHESGVLRESTTECYAIQLVPRTARMLGLSPEVAHRLGYVTASDYGNEPPGYATRDCRKGGPLDLHEPKAVWPPRSTLPTR